MRDERGEVKEENEVMRRREGKEGNREDRRGDRRS